MGAQAVCVCRRTPRGHDARRRPGKAADFVHLCPPGGSELAGVLRGVESPEQALAALFTLAGSESVREVRVEGSVVYRSGGRDAG